MFGLRRYAAAALMTSGLAFAATASAQTPAQSDAEIRQAMMRESQTRYSGSCPCPYSTMRNGRRCGGHSAYSKPGGESPLCYESDISDEMVERYRARQRRS